MSAESSEYHQDQPPRSSINYVISTEVTDPSILESVADTVAGFINDVVPTSYTIPRDTTNEIQWAHLGPLEFDERESTLSTIYEKNSTPPLILVLGYNTGIQVWSVSTNGLAAEVVPWRPGKTKVFKILPSPHKVDSNCEDVFLSTRPLIALCDVDSATGSCCTLDFVSFKNFKQVKSIKFRNNILDVQANKRSVVVSFLEKIVVLDAFTLRDRCTVTLCPVISTSPIALGSRWLAYTEKTSISTKASGGGCNNEGNTSVATTVIQCAKYISKGIIDVGGSVVSSFTGSTNFKPGVVSPGSPQSSGKSDSRPKGIVTVLDIECDQVTNRDPLVNAEAVVAHFEAHNNPVASLKFDPSGMLLVTADVKGYDFHVFRIHPHPIASCLSSVHHLYILHRGDTTSRVQDMCFSPDSRWVTVSTRRGTTHVFPITPYGGPVGVRTHTTKHVVNKMSRYHRSAGLTGENNTNNPARSDSVTKVFPYANPRREEYPKPTVVNALAQIKQPTSIQTIQTSGTVQLRSTNVINPEDSNCIVACFAAPRDCIDQNTKKNKSKQHDTIESLFIIAYHGSLIQYDLKPCPARNLVRDRVCDDSPIELRTTPAAQWRLQRTPNFTDAQVPKKESYFEDIFSGVSKEKVVEQSDDYWLSQVEIVTHAGPHRRLWMGPQFTFKTYATKPGIPLSISNVQNIEIRRTHQPSLAISRFISFDPDSHASREFSPPYHNFIDEIEVGGDVRLEEDLADALIESPAPRDSGLNRALKHGNSGTFFLAHPGKRSSVIPAEFEEIEDEELPEIVRSDSLDFLEDFEVIQPAIEGDVNPEQIMRSENDTLMEVPYYRNEDEELPEIVRSDSLDFLEDFEVIQPAIEGDVNREKILRREDGTLMEVPYYRNVSFGEELEREMEALIEHDFIIQRAMAAQELRTSLMGSHEIGVSQIDAPVEQDNSEQSEKEEEQKSKDELGREEELRREEDLSEKELRWREMERRGREEQLEQEQLEEFRREIEMKRESELSEKLRTLRREEDLRLQNEHKELLKKKEGLRQTQLKLQDAMRASKEENLRREEIRNQEVIIEEQLGEEIESRNQDLLRREEGIRNEAELKNLVEYMKTANLKVDKLRKEENLRFDLSKVKELSQQDVLRRAEELRKQDELRKAEPLKREEKSKKEEELRKEEKLRTEDEPTKQKVLRWEEDLRREPEREQDELNKAEKFKREDASRKEKELGPQDQLKKTENIKKEVEVRKEESTKQVELKSTEILINEEKLKGEEELVKEGKKKKKKGKSRKDAELKNQDEFKKAEELKERKEEKLAKEIKKQDEFKRAEKLRREEEELRRKEEELRSRAKLKKEEQSKKREELKKKQEVVSKKERLKREEALKKMRMKEKKSSSSSVKAATSSKKSEGGASKSSEVENEDLDSSDSITLLGSSGEVN
ncbi:hypothetical protein WA026_009594 [Henosepilachna vigintioctopunctata]|uniref:BCAS3 WD40 domain-containing protein n=1 Tax=Henosepilachna vigintioctopunctata TaxID=420089 RepID=A0AAW1U567_9CUCU